MKDITLWTECVQSLPLKLKFMVIRLKGKPQNSFYKYTKHTKFSNNMCLSGGKKFYFFGKFGELFFFVTTILRFALLLNLMKKFIGLFHCSVF